MQVRDRMTRDVKTCAGSDRANRAAQLMWENDCGFVVVTTADRRVAGTVTDRDLCMASYTSGLAMKDICVADVMTTGVVTCAPEDVLSKAAARMRAFQVRRLPVVDDDGKLAGVVALADLAQHALLARPRSDVALALVAETLAEIGRPRRPLYAPVAVPAAAGTAKRAGRALLLAP